jgi:hypothetical protein
LASREKPSRPSDKIVPALSCPNSNSSTTAYLPPLIPTSNISSANVQNDILFLESLTEIGFEYVSNTIECQDCADYISSVTGQPSEEPTPVNTKENTKQNKTKTKSNRKKEKIQT